MTVSWMIVRRVIAETDKNNTLLKSVVRPVTIATFPWLCRAVSNRG